jgi:seryl-tRNA synthetase
MVELSEQLKAIQEKLQILLKQQQLLQKDNQKLKKELEKIASEKDQKEVQLQGLAAQIQTVKLSTVNWSSTEKAIMEKRIDSYLKDIEKCLLLLNT